jgi:hypothetical protein
LVEILLDSSLIAREPHRLRDYYDTMAVVEGGLIQAAVNRMAPNSAERLQDFVPAFVREQFLWDYADDVKLCYRLNQVMRRVGLTPLPESLRGILPEARRFVDEHLDDLLDSPLSKIP